MFDFRGILPKPKIRFVTKPKRLTSDRSRSSPKYKSIESKTQAYVILKQIVRLVVSKITT